MSSSDAFWENFASQLYGGTRIARVPEIIGSLWQTCGLQVGSAVADICCGRGYSSVELALRGAKVTAVDFTSEFIEELGRAAAALRLDITALHGDAREVGPSSPVCATMILWNSLGHQDQETDLRILANARRATHEGGLLALELSTLEELAREPRRTTTRDIGDGRSFRRIRDLNVNTGRLRATWEIVDQAGCLIQQGSFSQQVYPRAEIIRMLEATGWTRVTDSDEAPMMCEPTGTLFIGQAASTSGLRHCHRCRGIAGSE